MNRNRYLILIMGLALIGIIYFTLFQSNERNVNKPIKQTTEERLTSALVENARLSERVNCLEEMLADCQNDKSANTDDSNDLEDLKNKKEVKDSKSPAIKILSDGNSRKSITPKEPKKSENKTKVVIEKVEKEEKQETKGAKVVEETTPKVVYGRSSSSQENYFPAYFYEPGTEGVKFCVRLGGDESRHLPHLAITNGNIEAEANGISGYNWVVLGPVSDLIGDWGITEDKTFFVSVEMVEQFLTPEDNGIVELKAPATHWKPVKMTRFDDYYIYRVK